jgi:hypothetical protein
MGAEFSGVVAAGAGNGAGETDVGGAVRAGAAEGPLPCLAPRPSAMSESEFNFPVASRFWSCWNRRMASVDSVSQTPLGSFFK